MPFNILDSILFLLAYLIGSIPTGFIVARLKGINDIRQYGSGNIGASNVSRFLGIPYFFIVLAGDAFKAYAFLSIVWYCTASEAVLLVCAAVLLLGNAYSIFLRGDGGKGVATLFGIICVFSPLVAIGFLILWICVLYFTRTAAVASLISVTALSIGTWFLHTQLFFSSCCALLFIFWRHRNNIYSLF